MDVQNQPVCIMKWMLERRRLLLHVGCANNLVIITTLVKIRIKLNETSMILTVCFLLFNCLNNWIVIYILVFVHLLIVIDCYMLQI